MIPLKYATDSQTISVGFFLDNTNGDTEETGLTVANTDIWLVKNGGTTVTNKNSGGATHIQNGIYYLTLDSTDTDTYGPMRMYIHVSGSLPIDVDLVVMNVSKYNELYTANT